MKRKLIQHGLSSLTVSLPRSFVKSNNLKKGEEIEVNESKSDLIISVRKHSEHKKVELDISGAGIMIRKIVASTFKAGFDEILIKFTSSEELMEVQNLSREQFSGFQIMEQKKDFVILKNISENNFEEFSNVLRRFFLVINQISEEFSNAILKNDFSWLETIGLMKIESDKFADYCRRAINLGAKTNYKRDAPLYTLIEQFEKVADRYSELCSYIAHEKLVLDKEIKVLFNDLFKFEQRFYELFYKFDIQKMAEFGKNKKELQKEIDKLMIKASKKEIKIIALADRILNLIFDINGPLMGVYI